MQRYFAMQANRTPNCLGNKTKMITSNSNKAVIRNYKKKICKQRIMVGQTDKVLIIGQ